MTEDSLLGVHFILLPSYEKAIKGLFSEDDERGMEKEIAENPKHAPVIRGTGGVRKIRVALEGAAKVEAPGCSISMSSEAKQ